MEWEAGSGPQSYRLAHGFLDEIFEGDESPNLTQRIALAQVYATLALAAATALRPYDRAADPDQESGDWESWLAVADTEEQS